MATPGVYIRSGEAPCKTPRFQVRVRVRVILLGVYRITRPRVCLFDSDKNAFVVQSFRSTKSPPSASMDLCNLQGLLIHALQKRGLLVPAVAGVFFHPRLNVAANPAA